MAKKQAVKKSAERYVIIGNGSYGLYYGKTSETNAAILARKNVTLTEARHVRYWYGKTGGITSLAAFGPVPEHPSFARNRIGAPAPEAGIDDVKTIFTCTAEAVANFARVVAANGS